MAENGTSVASCVAWVEFAEHTHRFRAWLQSRDRVARYRRKGRDDPLEKTAELADTLWESVVELGDWLRSRVVHGTTDDVENAGMQEVGPTMRALQSEVYELYRRRAGAEMSEVAVNFARRQFERAENVVPTSLGARDVGDPLQRAAGNLRDAMNRLSDDDTPQHPADQPFDVRIAEVVRSVRALGHAAQQSDVGSDVVIAGEAAHMYYAADMLRAFWKRRAVSFMSFAYEELSGGLDQFVGYVKQIPLPAEPFAVHAAAAVVRECQL